MNVKRIFFIVLFLPIYTLANIQNPPSPLDSPLGKWITTDRATSKPSGMVEMTERQGVLYGKIIAGFNVDPIKYCEKCLGELKNKPVIGLTFLWGFVPDGKNRWNKGHILNPHDGKVYKGSIILSDHGKKLLLRGYWGIFFRTETWVRST